MPANPILKLAHSPQVVHKSRTDPSESTWLSCLQWSLNRRPASNMEFIPPIANPAHPRLEVPWFGPRTKIYEPGGVLTHGFSIHTMRAIIFSTSSTVTSMGRPGQRLLDSFSVGHTGA